MNRMVELTKEELELLIGALRVAARRTHRIAESYPLRSQDPETERYTIMEEATKYNDRALELERLL